MSLYNFNNEIKICCLIHQLATLVGTVCKKVFYRRPVLFHPFKHCLSSDTVCNVGRGQIYEQEPTIRINGNMPFPTNNFLVAIYTACLGLEGLDTLAVQYAEGREFFFLIAKSVKHNADIQDG